MKLFYGIEYLDHYSKRACTIGEPNSRTGRMSIASTEKVFITKIERDEWVDEKFYRIPATKRIVREHCLGMSVAQFEEHLEWIHV